MIVRSRAYFGFTLIELLIVVAIIAILAVLAIPRFNDAMDKSRISRVQADFDAMKKGIYRYKMDNGQYPDMYSIADFVLYPSSWEGFGNQLLEAFAAGLPVVVFEYPVYKEDIAPKGVKVISLGDDPAKVSETRLSDVVDQMIPLLAEKATREQVTSHNRAVGKRYFDFEVLRTHLAESVRWAAERGNAR